MPTKTKLPAKSTAKSSTKAASKTTSKVAPKGAAKKPMLTTSRTKDTDAKVSIPKGKLATAKVPKTDTNISQGTQGERDAMSKPDPEIKTVSREDPSLVKDLHDNTKEQEHFEQKPAAEIAEIKTAVDAELASNEVVSEGAAPERSDENVNIITSEIDGKEQVVAIQSREEADEQERANQSAVNNAKAAEATEQTPLEKTIQKLNENPLIEQKKIEEDDKDATVDDKIVSFLKGKTNGEFVKINDFLKSLYPKAKNNEPNVWEQQSVAKQMRILLDSMQSHRLIEVQGNVHTKLGAHYYTPETQHARTFNLNTVDIYAKKVG